MSKLVPKPTAEAQKSRTTASPLVVRFEILLGDFLDQLLPLKAAAVTFFATALYGRAYSPSSLVHAAQLHPEHLSAL
ncbi:hypothetical protein [Microvirga makkahensis]|uniref:hypothetical protein n=1 Tax=Microvirga makkahensis TaxID=1128670 RepID=UPI001478E444|nr:hypothetical protein [Microvirga makkahensis]